MSKDKLLRSIFTLGLIWALLNVQLNFTSHGLFVTFKNLHADEGVSLQSSRTLSPRVRLKPSRTLSPTNSQQLQTRSFQSEAAHMANIRNSQQRDMGGLTSPPTVVSDLSSQIGYYSETGVRGGVISQLGTTNLKLDRCLRSNEAVPRSCDLQKKALDVQEQNRGTVETGHTVTSGINLAVDSGKLTAESAALAIQHKKDAAAIYGIKQAKATKKTLIEDCKQREDLLRKLKIDGIDVMGAKGDQLVMTFLKKGCNNFIKSTNRIQEALEFAGTCTSHPKCGNRCAEAVQQKLFDAIRGGAVSLVAKGKKWLGLAATKNKIETRGIDDSSINVTFIKLLLMNLFNNAHATTPGAALGKAIGDLWNYFTKTKAKIEGRKEASESMSSSGQQQNKMDKRTVKETSYAALGLTLDLGTYLLTKKEDGTTRAKELISKLKSKVCGFVTTVCTSIAGQAANIAQKGRAMATGMKGWISKAISPIRTKIKLKAANGKKLKAALKYLKIAKNNVMRVGKSALTYSKQAQKYVAKKAINKAAAAVIIVGLTAPALLAAGTVVTVVATIASVALAAYLITSTAVDILHAIDSYARSSFAKDSIVGGAVRELHCATMTATHYGARSQVEDPNSALNWLFKRDPNDVLDSSYKNVPKKCKFNIFGYGIWCDGTSIFYQTSYAKNYQAPYIQAFPGYPEKLKMATMSLYGKLRNIQGESVYPASQVSMFDTAASFASEKSYLNGSEAGRMGDEKEKLREIIREVNNSKGKNNSNKQHNLFSLNGLSEFVKSLVAPAFASKKPGKYVYRFNGRLPCFSMEGRQCISSSKKLKRLYSDYFYSGLGKDFKEAYMLVGAVSDGLSNSQGIDQKTWKNIKKLGAKRDSLKRLTNVLKDRINSQRARHGWPQIDFAARKKAYRQEVEQAAKEALKEAGLQELVNIASVPYTSVSPNPKTSFQADQTTFIKKTQISVGEVNPSDYEKIESTQTDSAKAESTEVNEDSDNLLIHDLGINKFNTESLFEIISRKYIKRFYLRN